MTPVILVTFLTILVVSTQGAALPIEELVDGLQKFLTAPETGLRLKRSPGGSWDKELDLGTFGVVFQLKYNDPSNPLKGGHAHVKFPGRRFFSNAPFDDVDLDIEFNGGDAVDGLFDMKVDYKFVQKFVWLADRPQEGSFEIYRKLEGGFWKTRITLDNNNREPRPFLDVFLETDRETKLNALFIYNEDNKWELKLDRVPGQSIAVDFVFNGVPHTGVVTIDKAAKKLSLVATGHDHKVNLNFVLNPEGQWGLQVTGDVDGPVDVKWTMQPDLKKGDIVVKYKEKSLAIIQLTGQAEMTGPLPRLFDYVIKYNVDDGHSHQGKAKVKFDGQTTTKKFQINYAPKTGQNFDYIVDIDTSAGIKYVSDLKVNGVQVELIKGDYTWTNDASKFEVVMKEEFEQTTENPFFNFNNHYLFLGKELIKGEKVRKIFINKQIKNKFLNQIQLEDNFIYNGITYYDFKYDTTVPKMLLKINFLPKASTEAWDWESTTEYTANGGFKVDYKLTHGDHSVHEGQSVVDVKACDENKFELESSEKLTMTEESPFYGMTKCLAGRYFKNGERTITLFFDKKKKNLMFVPLIVLKTQFTVDGQKIRQIEFDNTKDVRSFKLFWAPDTFSKDYSYEHTWQFSPSNAGLKMNLNLQRGGVSTYKQQSDSSWSNGDDKFELVVKDNTVQTEDSPCYGLGPFMVGKYYKVAERTRKIIYDKQNRNFLIGKILFEDTVNFDGEKYFQVKLDTTSSPYTLVWYQPRTGQMGPSVQQLIGQDEVLVSAWHTPGSHLKIESNLPEFQTFQVTTEGSTRKIELNGKEWVSVDHVPGSRSVSQTVQLLTGEHVTVRLAWPELETIIADLEFGVEITPDRKVEGKLGWECASNKVYLDVKGSNPIIGDYEVERHGELEKLSNSEYKLIWTGKALFSKGPLAPFSPIETHVVATFNTANLSADADVWKIFGGKKWGFTLANDRFSLLSGRP